MSRSTVPSLAGTSVPAALQRAFLRTGGAQVECQLALIQPQVAVDILERAIAQYQFAEARCTFASVSLIFSRGSGVSLNRNFFFGAVDGGDGGGRGSIGRLVLRKEWREVHARRRQLRLDTFSRPVRATNLPTGSCPAWLAESSVRCGLSWTRSAPLAATRHLRPGIPQLLQAGGR